MHGSEVLSNLEQATGSACALIDDFTTPFTEQCSHTALNYGFNVLPDDVLSEIFVIAATSLTHKVALSLVCKRFRGVMMSMREMWVGYTINSRQTPEEIIAIAEGNGFTSLKAHIYMPSPPGYVVAWIDKRGLDLEEYSLRYYKFLVKLILSFGPEELGSEYLIESVWKEIIPILASGNTQNLRSLVMPGIRRNSAGARLLESWHMPRLQNLEVGCVPGVALGRDLVRCGFVEIEEADFDSLKEFLAAANSLQDLRIFLSTRKRLSYEVDLPSVRSLEVNFDPHPSLARHLVRFQLFLSASRDISLSGLLEFLSTSKVLQEIDIFEDHWSNRGFSEGHGTINELPAVLMPSVRVVSCAIYKIGVTSIAKLRMPNLRTLKLYLRVRHTPSMMTQNEFRLSLQSMTSLEDLELHGEVGTEDVAEIIRYAPPHLQTVLLKGCRFFVTGVPNRNTTPAPYRNLIHFKDCHFFGGVDSGFTLNVFRYLEAVGLSGVKIQFDNCEGRTNGTFGLDDAMSAEIYRMTNSGQR